MHIDLTATRALVTLRGKNLVVVRSESHAVTSPSVEVGLHVDAAAGTLALANRPVLLKGAGSVDRRLVGAGGDGDIVVAAVSVDAALALAAR